MLIYHFLYFSRDDRRYQEKKNRAQRAQLKKEDNARLRKIVDTCLSMDPRIAKFRAEDKQKRAARKNPKQAAAEAAKEAAARKAEEERIAREQAEAAAKAAKKAKEQANNRKRRAKKAIKQLVEENNHGLGKEAAAPATPEQIQQTAVKLETIFAKNNTPEAFEEIQRKLTDAANNGNFPDVLASLAA